MNNLSIIGNLTRDVELVPTSGDTAIAKFGIAVNRKFKDKEEVSFFDCTAFGKTAETISRFFSKGKPIAVTGRLQQDRWEKDGEKRSKVLIIVENFSFLPKSGESEQGASQPVAASADSNESAPF